MQEFIPFLFIPELMKGLGQGMKEFKDASNGKDAKGKGEKIQD